MELARKLSRHGYSPEVVEACLGWLQAHDLQSDERYAEAFVSARLNKGQGAQRMQADLRARGVADDLIARYIGRADEGWRERLEQVRRKRFGPELPSEPRERARQARFLQYRGFSAEQIHKIFNQRDWD